MRWHPDDFLQRAYEIKDFIELAHKKKQRIIALNFELAELNLFIHSKLKGEGYEFFTQLKKDFGICEN